MKKLCCVVSVVPVLHFFCECVIVVEAFRVGRIFYTAAIASVVTIDLHYQHIWANLLLLLIFYCTKHLAQQTYFSEVDGQLNEGKERFHWCERTSM